MIEIIISIALVIFTAVALGMLANIYFDSERKDRIEAGVVALFILTILIACTVLCLDVNRRYYERKEYSITEYIVNQKIITVEEPDTVKIDTLYYFTRKNSSTTLD